ncbi:MAG: hypothetical protein QXP71_01585 [Desulfurococcaceae archaeon]|uniref:Uncharacterized protein n=1 Tax=Staphylothermus marinus TaxID=2280 RepID=A0A7C4D8E2_STAMA
MSTSIPDVFYKYFFLDRVSLVEKICRGESVENFLLEFTRTTPVVITYGSSGLSGSVKMVGFVPREDFIINFSEKAYKYAYSNRPSDMRETACLLLREFYDLKYIDPFTIGGLEMGFKHSWFNIRETGYATLLFYTPPRLSFEVRCSVEIRDSENDPYRIYLNSIHDIFHYSGVKSNYPAYLFKIREIYDNSALRNGFGNKIYP